MHSCKICSKSYTPSFHTLIHPSGCRFYKCSKCDHMFGQKVNLFRHLELHKDVRVMYSCNGCSKSFTRKDSLERHEKYHCCKTSTKVYFLHSFMFLEFVCIDVLCVHVVFLKSSVLSVMLNCTRI
ncbi:Zinc finger and BTB domain-containing protein like [Argiope bruennichi]|uniref:Zinc finger and BTB domain-containing protein like n=1 Tax=Argiope bruennichi TaxID=94029 RepID=A0A8T0EBN1_ARGBR|nr:Zinc finger and BTB domain-containing protein like [Argiope bruennichi]